MKRIIEEVFETEEKVSAILRQAQMQASEIRQSAEREISESLGARKTRLDRSSRRPSSRPGKRLSRSATRGSERPNRPKKCFVGNSTRNLDGLVETLCQVVRTTEYETDSH